MTAEQIQKRIKRWRRKVDELNASLFAHRKGCHQCGLLEWCPIYDRQWNAIVEALGRRKEAESILRMARKAGK